MKRKIVHTSVIPDSTTVYPTVIALCDDGTLWQGIITGSVLTWIQLNIDAIIKPFTED